MALTAWPWAVDAESVAARPGPLTRRTQFADGAAREERAAARAIPRYEVRVPGLTTPGPFLAWARANAEFDWGGAPARIVGGAAAVRFALEADGQAQRWTATLTVELLGPEASPAWTAAALVLEGAALGALGAAASGELAVEGAALGALGAAASGELALEGA